MPLIGLDNLYYAVMTSDTSGGATYSTPVKIAGAINIKVDPKQNMQTLYADNGPSETLAVMGEIAVEIEASDVTIDDQAVLLGHTISAGVIIKKTSDVAPYVAIGFKSKKSNGKYRYSWVVKGKFEEPSVENATTEDKPKFQTPKIKGTFIMRAYDSMWSRTADEDQATYLAATGTAWFNSVDGTVDVTAPTLLSTLPANAATAVAIGTTFKWTFSEAIQFACVLAGNFFVIKDTDGAVVAGSLAQSADKTYVTFTPTANLVATTAYRAICTTDVVDLSGNKLAAPVVYKFTTA